MRLIVVCSTGWRYYSVGREHMEKGVRMTIQCLAGKL
jgi:hypothetical protein